MKDKTLGIYVPSYRRSDKIITNYCLNDCTYVVRQSEEEAYKQAGVKTLSAPDHLIDSLPKVRQWIIENTPEDIIVQIDDDVENFMYVNSVNARPIKDKDAVDMELLRIAQIISDLQLGFASTIMQANAIKCHEEFFFKGTIGTVCWYNKSALKGRYDENVTLKADMDFELQELLKNRIMIAPSYLRTKAAYDRNEGGNNVGKNTEKIYDTVEYLKNKWGSYYKHNFKTNTSKVNVKR